MVKVIINCWIKQKSVYQYIFWEPMVLVKSILIMQLNIEFSGNGYLGKY